MRKTKRGIIDIIYKNNILRLYIYLLVFIILMLSIFLYESLRIANVEELSKEAPVQEWGPGFPRTAVFNVKPDYENAELNEASNFDIFSSSYRVTKEELELVRQGNPNIKIIPYFEFCGLYNNNFFSSITYDDCWDPSRPWVYETWFYHCELYSWTDAQDCWLYRSDNQHFMAGDNRWAFSLTEFCPTDNQGRRFSQMYADMVNDLIIQNSAGIERIVLWDGMNIDCTNNIYWLTGYNNGNPPDADRNHVDDTYEEFKDWWDTEGNILSNELRNYAGNGYFIIGNGQTWCRNCFNGFTIEYLLKRRLSNFNDDKVRQWQWTMFDSEYGYLSIEDLYLTNPFRASIIDVGWDCGDNYDPGPCYQGENDLIDFNMHKRFALGTVLLGDGFIAFDKDHTQVWWIPEFDNGILGNQHYLGQALGPCKIVEDDGTLTTCRRLDPDTEDIKVYRRDFENGIVLVNPSNSEKTIELETNYKVLDVVEKFTAPGGSEVNNITLPSFDSIILLRYSPITGNGDTNDNDTTQNDTNDTHPLPPNQSQNGECGEIWECTGWEPCNEGETSTRECTDLNNCGTTYNKPTTSEICENIPEDEIEGRIKDHHIGLNEIAIFIGIFILFSIIIIIFEYLHKLLRR